MNAIKATWKNGQIVTHDIVDWPEGCEVFVEPMVSLPDRIGINEADWRDDAAALADWEAWLATLEPLEYTPEEAAALAQFDAAQARFNIEAVRRQMAESQP